MKYHVRYKNISGRTDDALVRDLSARRIEKHLQHFQGDLLQLYATLEMRADGAYRAGLRLSLPGGVLATRSEDRDLRGALDAAFDELERRVRRYVERLRREHEWKRPARRERLRRLKQFLDERPQAERELYRELIDAQLPALTRFVRRELAFLQSDGRLPLDYPAVDDIVDEVLVRALDELPSHEAPAGMQAELNRLALDVLGAEAHKARDVLGDALSLEEPLPPQWLGRAWTGDGGWGDEDEGWQEDLPPRIEEVVPETEPSDPSAAVDASLARRHLFAALRLLPMRWRRIVMLSRMDEQPLDAVAAALGTSESAVAAELEHADAFLRERLLEAGIETPDGSRAAEYLSAPVRASQEDAAALAELTGLLGGVGGQPARAAQAGE